jgi:hypothetical protein
MEIQFGAAQKPVCRFNLFICFAYQLTAERGLALTTDAVEHENDRTIGGDRESSVFKHFLRVFAINKNLVGGRKMSLTRRRHVDTPRSKSSESLWCSVVSRAFFCVPHVVARLN